MGISFSLLLPSWYYTIKRKIFGLAKAEAVLLRSLSSGNIDPKPKLRSSSFRGNEISSQMVTCVSTMIERSLSFKIWESEEDNQLQNDISTELKAGEIKKSKDDVSVKTSSINRARETASLSIPAQEPCSFLPESLVEFCSPKRKTELDAAATTVQKIYKSYRTRRTLADCAVVAEELWWKALDYTSLKLSSVSFFDDEKQQTAVSRWIRAKNRLAKVGKGLSKDEKAQSLALRHWLEAIDPRHRYGHNLQFYYDVWSSTESTQPFFFWLDIGEGKEVNLEKCPRSKLQQQCITYLGPKERETYEVIIDNGKLVDKMTEIPVTTTEGSKWIFVLSTSRALYVGQKKKGSFQHSSFLAGGATTAAGRLVAEEGVLKAIWPYSGHYLPTPENFREFISFLKEHDVDLSNVKMHSIDDDDYLSFKSDSIEPETVDAEKREIATIQSTQVTDAEEYKQDTTIDKTRVDNAIALQSKRRLSCKWTTAAGARIGCVRDYPAELQSKALEHVNLSPRVIPSPTLSKRVPIPSPRPSPTIRLSPSLQYMGIPVPPPQLSPKAKVSPQLQYIGIRTPTVSLTLPKHRRG